MWTRTLIAATLVAMAGGCEESANNSSTVRPSTNGNGTTTAPITRAPAPALVDTGFLRTAASINQLEVELAKMASKEAESAEVKSLADMIGRDHADANERLKAIAESMRVEFPDDVMTEHKDLRNRLEKFEGAEFDREFITAMVDGHRAAIEVYEKEARMGENEALKRFAQAQLPALRMHLEKAEAVQRLMVTPPAPTSTPPAAPGATPPVQPPAMPPAEPPQPAPAPTGQPSGG